MKGFTGPSGYQGFGGSRRVPADTVYRYAAPTAMGTGDGATPENATALSGINALIAANRGAVIRLRADQGVYSVSSTIALSAGGVRITSWHPTDPDARAMFDGGRATPFIPNAGQFNGVAIFRLNSGASSIRFSDIDCQNVGNGFVILGAATSGLIVEDLEATNILRFVDSNGYSLTSSVFRRGTAFGFEKGFSRLNADSNNVLFEDIDADSDFHDDESFTSPFALEGTCHDITYRRVLPKNVVDDAGTNYWNGDGFSQEVNCYDILYDDCHVENTSDGGFDLKGSATLINCSAKECKRSLRLWFGPFTVTNFVSENPVLQGGSADAVHVGFYANGTTATFTNPTFVATPGNNSPGFKFDYSDCVATVYGTDNITLIEGQLLESRAGGVTGSEAIFDPPLPTIGVSLVWRTGFEDGDVPRDTAEGTAVADLVTTGTSPASLILTPALADAFVLDGSVVKVGSALAGAAATTMVIEFKAHHPRWIVFAEDEAVATLGELTYDIDAQTWFERSGGVPANTDVADALSAFVTTLKADGVWPHMVIVNHAWADSPARVLANMNNVSAYDMVVNLNANGQQPHQIPGFGGKGDFSQTYLKTTVNEPDIPEIANTNFAMGHFILTNFRSGIYGGTATGVGRNELPLGISPRPSSSTANLGTFATQLPAPANAPDPGFYAIEVNGLDYTTYGPDGLPITAASGTLNASGGAAPAQIAFTAAPITMYRGQAGGGACYVGFGFTATRMGATKMLALRNAVVALKDALRTAFAVTATGTTNLLAAGSSDDFTNAAWTKRGGATATANTDTHPNGFSLDTLLSTTAAWSGASQTVTGLTVGRYYCFSFEGISSTGSSLSVRPYACDAADAGTSLASYQDSPNVLRTASAQEGPQVLVFKATSTSMEVGITQGYPSGTATARSWRVGRAMLNEGVERATYVDS